MSAIPISSSMTSDPTKTPPAPAGVGFISLREAVYRSGVAMETLARRCRSEWASIGMAAILTPADGGKACWHVREDADAAFARVKSPEAMPFDRRKYTDDQNRIADRRKGLLDDWLEARAEAFICDRESERQVTTAFVDRCRAFGEKISRGTLYRWLEKFNAAGRAGLVDSRLKATSTDPNRIWFEQQLQRLYTSRRRTIQLAYDRAVDLAQELGRPVPYGYEQAKRYIRSLDPKMVCLHREGERVYKARFGRYIPRSHDLASNDLWMSDGHKFDVQVMYRGKPTRPILVSWMDIGSRKIVGKTIEPRSETSDAIRLAFKRGVQENGTPIGVYIDNGSGYDAEHMQGITKARRKAGERPQMDLGIFPRLNVEVTHARAYNAKAKGELERFHRTVCDRFSVEQPGYMGGNPINKPHTHAAEVKAEKLLDFDEFCQRFDDWLTADYHHRQHTGDGMEGKTPAAAFAERMREKRMLTPAQIELELCRRTRVTVGRNGVSVVLHGATLAYENVELDSIMGTEVDVVLDDDNLAQAYIYRLDGSRLCVADSIARLPVNATREQWKDASKSRRKDRQLDAKAREVRMRIHDDQAGRMHRLAVERDAQSPTPTPDVYRPVRPNDSPMRLADDTIDDDPYLEGYEQKFGSGRAS